MAKRASNTEPTFENLVGEFRALVDSMEDVFSAAAGDSGEKLTELKGQAEASLNKAKATLGDMERSAAAKARKIAPIPTATCMRTHGRQSASARGSDFCSVC